MNALCKVSSYHFCHLDNNMFAVLITINIVITHLFLQFPVDKKAHSTDLFKFWK